MVAGEVRQAPLTMGRQVAVAGPDVERRRCRWAKGRDEADAERPPGSLGLMLSDRSR
jgi:hypothetical protein